jgi:NADH-quinone oxidoreductase subunit F
MLDLSKFQSRTVDETCFHGRHIQPQIYADLNGQQLGPEGLRGAWRLSAALRKILARCRRGHDVLRQVIAEVKASQPARARRRRFPHRPEVELHAAPVPGRQVPGLQLRRGRAGHLQGPRHPDVQPARGHRGHGHRRVRHGHLRWATTTSTARSSRSTSASRRPLKRRALPATWAPKIHGQQASASSCTPTTDSAPTFAAKRPRLLESLEGKKGQPRFKPPFPASFGLYGKPTTINNTETFAAVPWIIRNGGPGLSGHRQAEQRRHQDLLGESGDVECARATYEVPMGTPFSTLLELAGGVRKRSHPQGRDSRAARRLTRAAG